MEKSKTKKLKRSRRAVDQAPETSNSGRLFSTEKGMGSPSQPSPTPQLPDEYDTLVLTNVAQSLSYDDIHIKLRTFGKVTRIRLVYDEDTDTNTCYATYAKGKFARAAFEAEHLMEGAKTLKLMRSSNVLDKESDYCPNMFEGTVASTPVTRKVPVPYWFVAYFRNGQGNFFRGCKFLEKHIGKIPEGHVKRYGRGLLVKAKDLIQARMLLHRPCPADGLFESIKPHRTFNSSKGIVYNRDLFEFPEDEILSMCPETVLGARKMGEGSNMILLTFHTSMAPDHIRIGDYVTLTVKPFVERPLQCFRCYDFGHGKKGCTNGPRCGHCSAVDCDHTTRECVGAAFCHHCKDGHAVNSRQCPKYRLEQEVLELANSQHISLGSARASLRYRLGKGGQTTTFASTVSRPAAEKPKVTRKEPASNAVPTTAPPTSGTKKATRREPPPSAGPSRTTTSTGNRFAVLNQVSESTTARKTARSPARDVQLVRCTAEIHAEEKRSPVRRKRTTPLSKKRGRGSSESIAEENCSPPVKITQEEARDAAIVGGGTSSAVASTTAEDSVTPTGASLGAAPEMEKAAPPVSTKDPGHEGEPEAIEDSNVPPPEALPHESNHDAVAPEVGKDAAPKGKHSDTRGYPKKTPIMTTTGGSTPVPTVDKTPGRGPHKTPPGSTKQDKGARVRTPVMAPARTNSDIKLTKLNSRMGPTPRPSGGPRPLQRQRSS